MTCDLRQRCTSVVVWLLAFLEVVAVRPAVEVRAPEYGDPKVFDVAVLLLLLTLLLVFTAAGIGHVRGCPSAVASRVSISIVVLCASGHRMRKERMDRVESRVKGN